MSGVFIQILMTRIFDLVLAAILRDGFSETIFFDRKVAETTTLTQAEQKWLVQFWAEHHELL